MAAENSNSIVIICPKEEEFETPPPKKSPSTTDDDEAIVATPISVCPPDHYHIEYHAMVDTPTNKETENPKVSPGETMTETPSATPNSSSRRGRRPKTPPEWIGNWTVDSKKRPHSNRFDKTYRHKVHGFLCRSLLECERYEKHGIRPQNRRMKAQVKAENSNKSENENKAIVLYTGKKKEVKKDAETEEAIIAKRRAEAESMRHIVEEFLAEAHYNQLHMFDP